MLTQLFIAAPIEKVWELIAVPGTSSSTLA